MTSKQQVGRKELDVAVEAPKKHQRNEESQHCITVAAQPIEITLGSVFVHKQHDARAAVERRDRQQIERAEQQVQEEKCQQRGCRQVVSRSRSIVVHPVHGSADANPHRREQHQRKIRRWACKRHPRRAPGIDRKSTRLNSSHRQISYAVFCLKKKKKKKKKNLTKKKKKKKKKTKA